MTAFETIAAILGKHSRKITTAEQAAMIIAKNLQKEELAEFIVEAFNRGWITKFNLGLNEDGKPI